MTDLPNLHIANESCPTCGMTLGACSRLFVDVHVGEGDEYLGTAYDAAECAPGGVTLTVIRFSGVAE